MADQDDGMDKLKDYAVGGRVFVVKQACAATVRFAGTSRSHARRPLPLGCPRLAAYTGCALVGVSWGHDGPRGGQKTFSGSTPQRVRLR